MSNALMRQTLPDQIYRILREDIITQKILCGSKLTLQALKDRFGVSHTPIREALTRLVEDGLINYYSNVGISVISLSADDINEIFRLNYDFDVLGIQYTMAGKDKDAFLDTLESNIQLCHTYLEKGDIAKWGECSDDFHMAFYDFSNNSRLESASSRLRAQLTLIYTMCNIEATKYDMIQQFHDDIFRHLKGGDIGSATDVLHKHMQMDLIMALDYMADN